MGKRIIIGVLFLGIIVVIYFWQAHLSSQTEPTISTSPKIPATSLDKQISEKVTTQYGDFQKVLLFDAESHLVFAESSSGIIPVLTNKDFTNFNKFVFPMLDFQEFKEETTERGPIVWQVKNNLQKHLSIVYGFAEDKAKTIIINSEGNIQPNKFFVRDNLWVWYATFTKDKIKLPIKVTVYDTDGKIIYGGNKKGN